MTVEKKFPFFIIGAERSGTTLLRSMLTSHPNIDIPLESDFIADIIDLGAKQGYTSLNAEKVYDIIYHHIIENPHENKLWEINADKLKEAISANGQSLRGMIEAPFILNMEKNGKQRWGDKTPKYARYAKEIKTIFPNAKFIHIIRDPRDVSVSLKKVPWGPNNIYDIADFWQDRVKNSLALKSEFPADYMELRYEELVREPEKELRQITEFLGEPYNNEMLHFYEKKNSYSLPEWHSMLKKKPDPKRIRNWKNHLKNDEVEVLEYIVGDLMDGLGYEKTSDPGFLKKGIINLTLLSKRTPKQVKQLKKKAKFLIKNLRAIVKSWE